MIIALFWLQSIVAIANQEKIDLSKLTDEQIAHLDFRDKDFSVTTGRYKENIFFDKDLYNSNLSGLNLENSGIERATGFIGVNFTGTTNAPKDMLVNKEIGFAQLSGLDLVHVGIERALNLTVEVDYSGAIVDSNYLENLLQVVDALENQNLQLQEVEMAEMRMAHPNLSVDKKNKILFENRLIQNLLWEQKFNSILWRKPCQVFDVPAVGYDLSTAVVNENPHAKNNYHQQLIDDEAKLVFFPVHPFNRSNEVPGYVDLQDNSKPRKVFKGYMTASRTMYITADGKQFFAVKIGTDHLLPDLPMNKVSVNIEEMAISRVHSDHIEQVDQALALKKLALREPFAALQAIDKNGVIVRDVTPLTKNYYLPALSIPYAGRAIAKKHGERYDKFWGKHYAYALGRAKAQLLLRYGLQMFTPNAQNMLIKLDPETLMPQKIIFRDLADAYFVEPIAKHLPFSQEAIKKDYKLNPNTIQHELYPYWENSSWKFNEGEIALDDNEIAEWGKQHYQGYLEEISQTLGIPMEKIELLKKTGESKLDDYSERLKYQRRKIHVLYGSVDPKEMEVIAGIGIYLESAEGQELLQKYGEKLAQGIVKNQEQSQQK
ncbi:MAG: hypothetical protein HQK50_12335 [Oligoflexia bacterium]|nr:hypothetical protein [Oligoflexia bacterium]